MRVLHFILLAVSFLATILSAGRFCLVWRNATA